MTIRNHPQREEILDLICAAKPGEVRAQVGDLKIRYRLEMLRKQIKREFGLDLSVRWLVQLRRRYDAARVDADVEAGKRLASLML